MWLGQLESMNLSSDDRPNFFTRCWNGQARLWQAFWLCGFCGKLLVVSLLFFAAIPLYEDPIDDGLAIVLFAGPFLGWYVFATVSIWRCSRNVSFAHWGLVAKAVTVVAGAMYIAAALNTF